MEAVVSAEVVEREVGGLRWLTVSGSRDAVFRTVGEVAAREIREVIDGLPEGEALRAYAETGRGSAAVGRLVAETRRTNARELRELQDLAAGAGVAYDAMLLANLRGDLGGSDSIGCTDIAWRGDRSFLAHNEDGAPALEGRFMLLSLLVDGEVPVTTQWYPGFLPSNAFAITGAGLAWGINHLQVNTPAPGAGRHFVARALQHCQSLNDAIGYLAQHPSAGGFTYNIGELGSGRVASVECAGGVVAVAEVDPELRPVSWHTNHVRYLAEPVAVADPAVASEAGAGVRSLGLRAESEARGDVLDILELPEGGPDTSWFLRVLAEQPAPCGVRRSAAGDDPLLTLCTAVVDLTGGTLTLQPRGGQPVTFAVDSLHQQPNSALA